MGKQLLHTPEGVRDVYGTEYEKKLKVQNLLHNKIALYGYEDIQTPSFEFKRFAKQLTKKEAAYGSVAKIYNGFVYWFFGNRAITIYPLPTKYKAYRK